MATQTQTRQPPATRNLLRPTGVVLLVVGLIGIGYWVTLWFNADLHGTVAEDSIMFDVGEVIDWIPKPGVDDSSVDDSDYLVIAKNQSGVVIFEGPQDEWIALAEEATSVYQAHLRRTWLYPASAVALAGLLMIIFGRRRTAATQDSRR